MTCRTLLLAHTRMAQPLAWSGGNLCVAYARASMPPVPRGPRRPPWHAWHRLIRPNLAAPAAASLSAIIAAPSVAVGAAGKATSNSYNVRNTKLKVLNSDPAATSQSQPPPQARASAKAFAAAAGSRQCLRFTGILLVYGGLLILFGLVWYGGM